VSTTELQRDIERLGPWFHDLDLGGIRTAPDHPLGSFLDDLWRAIEPAFPADMGGQTVLDVGCNAGFYSLKLAERGAQVTAIDHDPRYLAQASLAADVLSAELELLEMEVYDLDALDRTFDFVLFMGVLYHLRHPLLALEKVRARVGRRLVFQTMVRGSLRMPECQGDYPFDERAAFEQPGFPAMYFIEHRYAGDATNWWIPNDAAAAAMLRSVGLQLEEHPCPGVYVCSPDRRAAGRAPSHRSAVAGGAR
jgi:tRNA (mo5U34)-methyltransferase